MKHVPLKLCNYIIARISAEMNINKMVNRIVVTEKKCSIDPVNTAATTKVAMALKVKSKFPAGLDKIILLKKIINAQLLHNSKIFSVLLGFDLSLRPMQN